MDQAIPHLVGRLKPFLIRAFADMNWYSKIAISLVAITLLCFWSGQRPPLPSLRNCLTDPLVCDKKTLSTNAGGKVESVEERGFWLRNGDLRIWVEGQASGARVGDTVFLRAVFHQEGYLELQQVYISRYRDVRIAVSVLALVGVVWVFLRTYRFDPARFQCIRRS